MAILHLSRSRLEGMGLGPRFFTKAIAPLSDYDPTQRTNYQVGETDREEVANPFMADGESTYDAPQDKL